MARRRRRPVYFNVQRLHDGTILWAFPIRKPTKQKLKEYGMRIDPDGVAKEWTCAGDHLRDVRNDTRTRFQDIIATSLNTRRALRELVLPQLVQALGELREVGDRLDRIEALLREPERPGWSDSRVPGQ